MSQEINDIKISFVVPVFNRENYLNRCLDSIINQTYSNIEIICVDDGSTDNSPAILDEYCKKDSRIQVIHKENEGAGEARNSGLTCATGDYITFIDSDDYIDINLAKDCVERIKQDNSQVVLYGFYLVDSKGNISSKIPNCKKNLYLGKEVIDTVLFSFLTSNRKFDPNTLTLSLCAGVFEVKSLKENKWKCASERKIVFEDFYSFFDMFSFIDSVSIIQKAYYYYCYNLVSLSRTNSEGKLLRVKNGYFDILSLVERLKYGKKISDNIGYIYLMSVVGIFYGFCIEKRKKELKNAIKNLQKDNDFRKIIKKINLNNFSLFTRALYFALKRKLNFIAYLLIKIRCKIKG